MTTRKKLMLGVMGMMLAGLFAVTGCKNACDKLGGFYKDCYDSFCAEHGDDARCVEAARTAAEEAMGASTECTDELKAAAEAMMEAGCDALFPAMPSMPPMPGGGEN